MSIVLARDITANALSRRISPGEAIPFRADRLGEAHDGRRSDIKPATGGAMTLVTGSPVNGFDSYRLARTMR